MGLRILSFLLRPTKISRLVFVFLFVVTVSTPCSGRAAELLVFAAISLSDALKEIAPLYEKTSSDTLSLILPDPTIWLGK